MTEAELTEIEEHAEEAGPWYSKQARGLVAEVRLLRERVWLLEKALADEHRAGRPGQVQGDRSEP